MDLILRVLDLAAVSVFAVSGALTACRKGLDLLGVLVIAALTAVGGGTLRDLLLDRQPIFWLRDSSYLLVIAGSALATVFYARRRTPPGAALAVADALGLGFAAVAGAQIAEQAALPPVSVVLLGTMTGVAGGALRDVLCAEIPFVLRRDVYATACIVGLAAYVALRGLGVAPAAASVAGMGTIVALRGAAIAWGLRLPVFRIETEA